jgi:hypothetical protein
MEKLILRGIMYGADKIPDSWFEKVPGGFYKQKERERQQHENDEKRRSQSSRRDKSRRRRHSDEYEDRRPHYDEDSYAEDRPGRATERRKRHERGRSSYDGGADYDSEESERERRRARRRTHGDDDRYGYDNGYSRPDGARDRYVPQEYRPSLYPDPSINSASKRNSAAAAAASAGAAAAIAQQSSRQDSVASPPIVPVAAPVPGALPATYIPYANIYGAGAVYPQGTPQMFSPPPPVSISPIVPGVPPVHPYGHPAAITTSNPRGISDLYSASKSRQRDPYFPSHSPSSSHDGGAAIPSRSRSERRPTHDQERSRGE